jgi:NAD(P)-dependent dehydrogenase (short-subunit alcohol dehydrogenase family)
MRPSFRLDGDVAVVTGVAGNLGSVWSEALAGAGATVVGVDLPAAVADAGEREGTRLESGDVTDRGSLDALRERIERELGPPTVLVNNAGIDQPPGAAAATYAVEDIPVDEFRATVDVNLAGTFNATQAFGAGATAGADRSSTSARCTPASRPTPRSTTTSRPTRRSSSRPHTAPPRRAW